MGMLYKYYSNESEYAYKNIEDGNICFSPLECLNDPLEGYGAYLYKVSDEEQIYWNSIGSDLPKMLSKRFSEEFREVANFKYRVFCASKEYDNPLLWAYYANCHKGFCVGYKKSSIGVVSDKLFDMNYKDEMYPINESDEKIFEKLLSVKSIDWKNENECRALYELKCEDIGHSNHEVYFKKEKQLDEYLYILNGNARTNDLRTLYARKFICKKCSPVVIYLGMKMEWNDKKRLIDIAHKLKIKVYQMSQEQNSFKFIHEDIIY
ncbi:DUF2971 domain-containing protein [Clostridium perfringens]|uniref:DUF2971 domain-containing protein n=1 Tax=Clostridium perfringens TaxID=1502 RepID=UPI002247FE50|nr:DUF2971 domain-containing protein [Clostridium perfringens]MCX0398221.1 DUF2971 domain-containing protein [Clostridium perfringens]